MLKIRLFEQQQAILKRYCNKNIHLYFKKFNKKSFTSSVNTYLLVIHPSQHMARGVVVSKSEDVHSFIFSKIILWQTQWKLSFFVCKPKEIVVDRVVSIALFPSNCNSMVVVGAYSQECSCFFIGKRSSISV